MNNSKNTVTAYILAGGKSSRMGKDKGLILFNGKAIIQHIIEKLQPVTDKVVIISNNPAYDKFGVEVIEDLIRNLGPAGGIFTALSHSQNEKNLILSCDTPFITTEAIEYIFQHSDLSQISWPIYDGKIEPLFGVYSKSCLAKWEKLIHNGILKLQEIASNFNLNQLNVDNNPLFNKNIFTNINTPEDFENLKINTHIWKL